MNPNQGNRRHRLHQRLITIISKLNLYDDEESLPVDDQILSTRVYIILFLTSILILLVYTSLSLQMQLVTVAQPSLSTFERLSKDYSLTLSCRCSNPVHTYGKFIQFNPEYHQICSSELIEENWISSLSDLNLMNYHPLDYRLLSSSQFQMLALFCQISQEFLTDALEQFQLTSLITIETLFPNHFEIEISDEIEQLQMSIIAELHQIDSLTSLYLTQNRLVSTLRTNFFVQSIPGVDEYISYSAIYPDQFNEDCVCEYTFKCTYPSGFYQEFHPIIPGETLALNQTPSFLVPGMKVGCTTKDSLSQSTLECFFDQTCLNTIASLSSTTQRPSSLNAISHFHPNTTINEIFEQLMLESLNARISFDDYYRSCSPQICTYSYSKRFSLVYILTTITSLIGGLTAIFRILSPLLVQFILRKIQHYFTRHDQERISTIDPPPMNVNIRERLKTLLVLLSQKLLTLNLFKKRLLDVKHGIYSTRVYLLLLVIGVTVLTIYFSMTSHVFTHSITRPTLEQYEDLYRNYSTTLNCPCERISVNYSSIMTLIPRYHQICTSGFVRNEQWLNIWSANQTDYRLSNQPFFLTLKFICDLSATIVPDLLVIFNSTQFISTQVIHRENFESITNMMMSLIDIQIGRLIVELWLFLEGLVEFSQFIVNDFSNVKLHAINLNGQWSLRYLSRSFIYDDTVCRCGLWEDCYPSQQFFSNPSQSNLEIFGFYQGCSPLGSFMHSTLECFYDEACIEKLIQWRFHEQIDVQSMIDSMDLHALDSNLSERIYPDDVIREIFSYYLFVEDWIRSSNYTHYYHLCNPSVCVYTTVGRYHWIHLITYVIGLIGGLTIALKIFVPSLVKFLIWIYGYFSNGNRVGFTRSFIGFIRENLIQLNLYERQTATTVNPILITRIYLILLIISMIFVSTFTGIQQQTLTFTIQSPNETYFNQLYDQYPSTLKCPCTNNLIPYTELIRVDYTLHEICYYYGFELPHPIDYLEEDNVWIKNDLFVFVAQFDMLTLVCLQAKLFWIYARVHAVNKLISFETLSPNALENEVNSFYQTFIEKEKTKSKRYIDFIIKVFRSNQLEDLYMSNWNTEFSNQTENYILRHVPVVFDRNCTCATTISTCSRSLVFMDESENSITLPGLVGGCSIMDGLRQSTLRCFYDQICLDELQRLLQVSDFVPLLDSTVPTRYPPNTTTLGTMMDELFVESWNITSNYTVYFEICAPSECYYSYTRKNNLIVILTTLLGLCGGLAVALKLLVWHSLHCIYKLIHYCREKRQIHPSITINDQILEDCTADLQ